MAIGLKIKWKDNSAGWQSWTHPGAEIKNLNGPR